MSSTTITTTPKRTWKRKLFTSSSKSKRARTSVRAFPSTIVRGPIPKSSMIAMTYFNNFSSPGTTFNQKTFNLNSIYSPEYTGGHQPYGHDTYATLYNRYRVIKVDYVFRVVNCSTSLGAGYNFGLIPNNTTTVYTLDTLAFESPLARHDVIQQGNDKVMTGTYYPATICGATVAEYKSDDRYQALMGSTPTENIILHVVASGLNGVACGANALQYSIKLRYYAILSDRKDLSQS